VEDDSWFGIIFTLDGDRGERGKKAGGLAQRDVWYKANPNLGVSKKWSDMRTKAARAKSMTRALNAFLQKELNVGYTGR